MTTLQKWLIRIIIFIVFLALLWVVNSLYRALQREQQSTEQFQRIALERDKVINVQNQNIFTYQQAIAHGLIERDALRDMTLKAIQAQVKAQEIIKNLETIIASYEPGTVIITDTIIMQPEFAYLRLPASWQYRDEWLSLRGTNTINGVEFSPGGITIQNSPQFTLAWRHRYESGLRNFFSRPDPVVIYQNPNPYATVSHMENVIVQEPPKWYERRITWFVAGVLIGSGSWLYLLY